MRINSLFGGALTLIFLASSIPAMTYNNEVNSVSTDKELTTNLSLYQDIDNIVIENAEKAVVSVINYDKNGNYYGLGSGVIFKSEGSFQYLITNYHVVEDGATFEVVSWDMQRVYGIVIGYDSIQDCAVIRIPKLENANVAVIGDSSLVVVGEEVFAIGNPADISLKNTITRGIVSGLNRVVNETGTYLEQQKHAIQLDLAINPGNSGGALFNEYGELIGINTLKLTSDGGTAKYEGINLALPISDMFLAANRILSSAIIANDGTLLQNGTYTKSSLGIANFYSLRDISLSQRNQLNIPSSVISGVLVRNIYGVLSNPLNTNNIGEDSIIVSYNGTNVVDKVQLRSLVYNTLIGTNVSLTILKKVNNSYQTVVVTTKIVQSQY
ncbi:MAG: trypsin-like peptidase domain-containing protein [Bacilli bacterium]|nr:trypsin-like peptidase domain-containing protein [Bacilli bacterium]